MKKLPFAKPLGDKVLFFISSSMKQEDRDCLPEFKKVLAGRCQVRLTEEEPVSAVAMLMLAKEKGCSRIATSNSKLLAMLLDWKPKKSNSKPPSLDDYAGSIIDIFGWEVLVLQPLSHLYARPEGKFLAQRYWSKFYDASSWLLIPDFSWELLDAKEESRLLRLFATSIAIAIDIETVRDDPERIISCIGFSSIQYSHVSKSYSVHTVVVPLTDEYNLAFARRLCSLNCFKILQNGKYDIAYLLRYGIIITNWLFDTIELFHAWYSELPKRLDFILSFTIRKWQYWKSEAASGDITDFYRYNAKDSFATAIAFISLMQEMPPWAIENYKVKFPLVFPCVLSEHTGIRADIDRMKELNKQVGEKWKLELAAIRVMVDDPNFNPNSPLQTLALFKALGSEDVKKADAKAIDKVKARHPINYRILNAITKSREDKKLTSTYLDVKDVWHDRIYYTLNPSGTDTARLSSRKSSFWCGWQIQNIPRDKKDIQVKSAYCADEGFYFGEADFEQNEARGTAYLSGDLRLIATVESDRDYHSINVERFFGIPYEQVVASDGTVLLKDIRDLSKRTNHGSNYNMGAAVLLDTMGIENVLKARKVLKLQDGRTLEEANFSLLMTTKFMLAKYEEAYPDVKGRWYDKCKRDVDTTRMLIGPTGWHRYCFGSPSQNKRDLNRYVAHPPQSLGAMTLNSAFIRVFNEVWLPNQEHFKLLAQIHDSIIFMYRIGYHHLAREVKRCMEQKVAVKCSAGVMRELFVPVALKGEATRWSEIKEERKWKLAA